MPQKITPALKVRAETAPTFRLKVSLRSMLSCLLLWLRNSSRQLQCPASRFIQSSFITLHYDAFTFRCARSLRLGHKLSHESAHITTNFIHFFRKVHSTSFRFIPSSFTQQAAVHPLPLLWSPALSFGLRAVMLFAPPLVG